MRQASRVTEALLIGEFARRCRLPVSTLRYYDRIGLLAPAAVDEASGYRRYDAAQLPTAELIERLRAMGVGPTQIAAVLAGGDAASAALLAERRRVSKELERGRRRLRELDALLAAETSADHRVGTRDLSARQVVIQEFTSPYPDQEAVVIRAIGELRLRLRRSGSSRVGAWGATFPLDIEDEVVGFVFTEVAGDVGFPTVELPGGPAVSTVHRGGLDSLSLAYVALFAEIERLGGTPQAPVIEDYLPDGVRLTILYRAR